MSFAVVPTSTLPVCQPIALWCLVLTVASMTMTEV
jgi:hypothetical protein